MTPEILPLGDDGVLLRHGKRTSPETSRAVRGLLAAVQALDIDGVVEVAGALTSVLVRFDPEVIDRVTLVNALRKMGSGGEAASHPARLWRIPVAFGGAAGPQLDEAADLVGVSVDQAIADMLDHPLDILAIGFAPGQPYLGHLAENWDIPRQSGLTPKVPAGAIVVALRQVIPFTVASTTGWRPPSITKARL